jgi:hypothetical protein
MQGVIKKRQPKLGILMFSLNDQFELPVIGVVAAAAALIESFIMIYESADSQ